MSKTIAAALLAFLITTSMASSQGAETLNELLVRIAAVPDGESGLSKAEQAFIQKLLEHENEAIPHLVELLSHSDDNVAEIAAAALGDCTRIDPKYLPQIITGLDRGISWLPRALGRIESDLAAEEAVKRFLSASSSPNNQEAYALELQGMRAIPFIIEAAVENKGRDPNVYYLLGHALGEMGDAERRQAATGLLNLLKDKNASVDLLQGTLRLVSGLDKAALHLEDELLELRESNPALEESIDSALIGIRSAHSGRIFAEILRRNPDILILRDIAEIGEPAQSAGGEIAKLLDHSDWELRLGAARTLGFIGYHGADDRLIELVNEPSDVRLNLVATESLGRLKVKTALETLRTAATAHWHPTVRDAASIAADKIENGSNYKLKYHRNNFPLEYFDYQNMGVELPDNYSIPAITDPLGLSAYAEKDSESIGRLVYPSEIISYGASDEDEQKAEKGDDAIIVVSENNMIERRQEITQTPEVGVHVPGGWLLGGDRGEWGGELVCAQHGRVANGVQVPCRRTEDGKARQETTTS